MKTAVSDSRVMSCHSLKALLAAAFLVTTGMPAKADYLTPAGEPGSRETQMRTLNEVEPRTVIDSLPFSITNEGTYFLTKNLTATGNTDGVRITVNDVSIDLNGFSLIGKTGSTRGVNIIGSLDRIEVRNGTIRNWGNEGVDGDTAVNCRYENLLVCSNGLTSGNAFSAGANSSIDRCIFLYNKASGLYVSDGCKVENCIFRNNGAFGLFAGRNALIRGCTASENTFSGFRTTDNTVVSECNAIRNGDNGFYTLANTTISRCSSSTNGGDGFNVGQGCVVSDSTAMGNTNGFKIYLGAVLRNCTAYRNQVDGINAFSAAKVQDCTASENGEDGIDVAVGSLVSGCLVNTHPGSGIKAATQCRIVNNSCRGNLYGIYMGGNGYVVENFVANNTNGIRAVSSNCVILRNYAVDNTTDDYNAAAGNAYGPELSTQGTITTNNPWINFAY